MFFKSFVTVKIITDLKKNKDYQNNGMEANIVKLLIALYNKLDLIYIKKKHKFGQLLIIFEFVHTRNYLWYAAGSTIPYYLFQTQPCPPAAIWPGSRLMAYKAAVGNLTNVHSWAPSALFCIVLTDNTFKSL